MRTAFAARFAGESGGLAATVTGDDEEIRNLDLRAADVRPVVVQPPSRSHASGACVCVRVALLVLLVLPVSLLGACASVPPLPPRASELNRAGAAALALGDLDAAAARLELALEYSPRFTEAWVNLGYVELRRGRVRVARHHFAKARRLNPDLAAPHHALGLVADREGEGSTAEKHYREALKVDPGFVPSRVNLSRRLFERQAFDDARAQFLKLTQVEPDAAAGYVGLTECLLRLEREGEADDVMARARARFGDLPELTMLVGRQLLRRGAYAEAEDAMSPITGDADRSRAGAAWAWIGVARLARGDRSGAQRAAREALLANGDDDVAKNVASRAR